MLINDKLYLVFKFSFFIDVSISNLFYIESEYCVDDQCDTYTEEISINDVMLSKFSLNSYSGKKAIINLDIVTFNICVAVDDQDEKTITRNLKGSEFVIKDYGS